MTVPFRPLEWIKKAWAALLHRIKHRRGWVAPLRPEAQVQMCKTPADQA